MYSVGQIKRINSLFPTFISEGTDLEIFMKNLKFENKDFKQGAYVFRIIIGNETFYTYKLFEIPGEYRIYHSAEFYKIEPLKDFPHCETFIEDMIKQFIEEGSRKYQKFLEKVFNYEKTLSEYLISIKNLFKDSIPEIKINPKFANDPRLVELIKSLTEKIYLQMVYQFGENPSKNWECPVEKYL